MGFGPGELEFQQKVDDRDHCDDGRCDGYQVAHSTRYVCLEQEYK